MYRFVVSRNRLDRKDGECSFYEDHLQDQVIPNANDSLK